MTTFESRPGDIFEEDVEAIVNTVNCEGVMGKGLALQFKRRYPENYEEYVVACAEDKLRPGRMLVSPLAPRPPPGELHVPAQQGRFHLLDFSDEAPAPPSQSCNPRFINNFPTKDRWRRRSKLEYIESGLEDLVQVIKANEIRSIAVPALGRDLAEAVAQTPVRPVLFMPAKEAFYR